MKHGLLLSFTENNKQKKLWNFIQKRPQLKTVSNEIIPYSNTGTVPPSASDSNHIVAFISDTDPSTSAA